MAEGAKEGVQNGSDTIDGALVKVEKGVVAQKDLNVAASEANVMDSSFSGSPVEAGAWTTFDIISVAAILAVLGYGAYQGAKARGMI